MSDILREFIPSCPDGWAEASIGEALTEVDRPIQMRDSTEYRLASIRRRNGGMFHRETLPGRKILTKTLREVVPRSFVLARMQVVHGACALAPDEFAGYAISKSYSSFVGTTKCDIRFFSHLAKQPFMYRYFTDASHGVVIEKMTFDQDRWLSFPIYLPPLEEQQQIAEVLDMMDQSIKTTERLIAKLRMRHAGLMTSTIDQAVGGAPTVDCTSVLQIQSGITLNPSRAPRKNAVGYLRVANVRRDAIDLDDVALMEATPEEERSLGLQVGDILVVEGHADPGEIGRAAMVRQGAEGLLFQNHLFRLRPNAILGEYALEILNSNATRAYWRRVSVTSSGLYTINARKLAHVPIPSISTGAQERIARIASDSKTSITTEQRRLAKLKSIRTGLAADLISGRVRTVAS